MSSREGKRQGGPGRPFAKGVSGNPGGQASKSVEQRALEGDVRRYAKTFTKEAIDKLVAVMRGEEMPVDIGERGKKVMARPGITLQMDAAVHILNRGHGTPHQSVAVTSDSVTLHVGADDLDEQLEGRIAGIRERLREQGVLERLQ